MHKPQLRTLLLVLLFVATAPLSARAQDDAIPEYEKVAGVAGTLSSVGSDTLAILMSLWAEEFKRLYPNITLQVYAGGSATAPPALQKGTANIALMSRRMTADEVAGFDQVPFYQPAAIPVAIDALSVYVHQDNPIEGLTFPQLDAIFSVTRKCGAAADIRVWEQLGVTGELGNRPMQLFGRNAASGTYAYFKQRVLCDGDFKSTVNEMPGSASVVQSVTVSPNSIGYSGMGYRTSGVKAVPLAKVGGDPFVAPTVANTLQGAYPLGRVLYVYVRHKPGEPLPPLEREFIKLVLSKTGQQIVTKGGYIPLPASLVVKHRASDLLRQ